MFEQNISGNLEKRAFDDLEKARLGKYIYALRDPRDRKIFYVGQGQNNRVFDHFDESENCLKNNTIASSKVIRILDIWKNNEDVDWVIIAYNLSLEQANFIESSAYDILSESQNGITLNDVKPPYSSILTKDEIKTFSATPVNPINIIEKVFIFPIQNALADGHSIYDATRSSWYVKENYQKNSALAVGIRNNISVGSFKIEQWHKVGNKHEFAGVEENTLLNKNWSKIISLVKGYWQRGNYLIVKFDGNGKFCIIRGNGRDEEWFPC